MHKTSCFDILLVVALLLAVSLVIFLINQLDLFENPRENIENEIVIVDGVRQYPKIYIANAYYENGFLHFTVVNESSKSVCVGDYAYVERRVDGVWKYDNTTKKAIESLESYGYCGIRPSDRSTFRVAAEDIWHEVSPGSFRILADTNFSTGHRTTADGTEERYLIYPGRGGYCIVGYFTITEDMLK